MTIAIAVWTLSGLGEFTILALCFQEFQDMRKHGFDSAWMGFLLFGASLIPAMLIVFNS